MPKGVFKRPVRSAIIPIGPSIAYIPLTQDRFCLIDSEIAGSLGMFNWYALANKALTPHLFYAQRTEKRRGENKPLILMHRVILGASPDMCCDHINGNSLDNRICNLREATRQQNCMNGRKRINNSSGYKGVHYCKNYKGWVAAISINKKRTRLGVFQTAKAAHAAYCEAAEKYHGDFARVA